MRDYRLHQEKIFALRQLHRMTKEQRKADRIKAVIHLANGWTAAQVAEALLVDEKTVVAWFERYAEGGEKRLMNDEHRGGLAYLSTVEQEELTNHLRENHYLSTKEVIAYAESQYGITYTQSKRAPEPSPSAAWGRSGGFCGGGAGATKGAAALFAVGSVAALFGAVGAD